MPIGVPRIIYCWGEELPAQWTDIYNFIFRRRMVFLMQYLDDELCNQICGLLINIHMEDRSKEMEKKETERSGVFKSTTKSNASLPQRGEGKPTQGGRTTESSSFYNKKARSMEDLLNADEDLGIDEVDKLEQYTLQKITTEWLNWNAQFFDYSDEPYLYYLAELLSKDFNKTQMGQGTNENSEISQLLNMLKNKKEGNSPNFVNKGNIQMGEVYSPFRTNANFSTTEGVDSYQDIKQQMLLKHNAFVDKKAAKKQKLLEMFQSYQNLSSSLKQDKTHKNISNLLTNLAQKNFSSKLNSKSYFEESSEAILGQRNLRREYNLESNFSSVGNMKSFNYLNSSGFMDNSQSEFRDYYRKQTQRTLMDEESKKVFVIINSFGGSVGNGITVHDALQFIKAGSLTLALGVAASAASLALAGGTIGERYVTEGCHVMIHQPECLTPDHNVLTTKGWIPITDVTLEHKVAVLDKNGVMTYQHPTKVHTYNYEGPMYEVKNTSVDLLVTPNHRMYVNKTNNSLNPNYQLVEASEIIGKQVRYKNNAIWNMADYQFALPGSPNSRNNDKNAKLDMNAWLTFFGLWIAKGHTAKTLKDQEKTQENCVVISDVNHNIQQTIENALDKLGYEYYIRDNQYIIQNKPLWSYLDSLNNNALSKGLPDWVWKLSSKQCKVLLDSLVLSNFGLTSLLKNQGSSDDVNNSKQTVHYFDESEALALDICRLSLHAGFTASMKLETELYQNQDKTNERQVHKNNPIWRVDIIKNNFYPFANHLETSLTSTKKQLDSSIGFAIKEVNQNQVIYNNAVALGQSAKVLSNNGFPVQQNMLALCTATVQTVEFDNIHARQDKTLSNTMNFKPISAFANGTSFGPTSSTNLIVNKNHSDDRVINYKGTVHCLTVPHNVFYVQRNGKAVWTGNSSLQGQASDIWIDSQEIMKIRLDVAEIYSLSTYRPRHKILRDLDRDFYLTATETIQYGLADEIATNEVMTEIIDLTNKVWDYHDAKQERLLDTRARLMGDSAQTQEST